MSDFYQQGLICTLQRLNSPGTGGAIQQINAVAQLEGKLADSPLGIVLVLPCHFSELGRPALELLIQELNATHFLREVVVSMNGMNAQEAVMARSYFARLRPQHRVLWNDSPRVQALLAEGDIPAVQGKGMNYWAACGWVLNERGAKVIVSQDCDVLSFQREMLVRLCAASALEGLEHDFSKLYYSRATDRFHGRVSRLFLAPLLRSLLRLLGHHPLLDFLLSFRYPLAGECAIRSDLAAALAISTGWGLEIGMLCEVFRHMDPRKVCQVDAGVPYDHKHQPLGSNDSGLLKMSREIADSLFYHLAAEGVPMDESFFSALASLFPRETAEAVRRYRSLAIINGLEFDQAQEQIVSEGFHQMLCSYQYRPCERNQLPAWQNRLESAWSQKFFAALSE